MSAEVVGDAKKVLVIVAHPDDAEITCGGTIAKWIKQGREVYYVLCTNGDKGSDDPEMTSERLAAIRQEEQGAAAAVLGVKEVVFLGYEDGMLRPNLELRKDITREIRRFKPDIAVCQDPAVRYRSEYINHPDHRAAGDAALDAIFPSCRDRLTFPELLAEGFGPHKCNEIYLGARTGGDTFFDITETIDIKIEALKMHRSQFPLERIDEWMRQWSREIAKGFEFEYAEAFKYLNINR